MIPHHDKTLDKYSDQTCTMVYHKEITELYFNKGNLPTYLIIMAGVKDGRLYCAADTEFNKPLKKRVVGLEQLAIAENLVDGASENCLDALKKVSKGTTLSDVLKLCYEKF